MKTAFLTLVLFCLTITGCTRSKPEAVDISKDTTKEEAAPASAEMSLEAQKHVGLQVTSVAESDMKEYLAVTGTVQPIDSRVGHVRPLAKGRLLEVMAKVGDRITKGQPLARFDNIEAGELAAQYESAQAELRRLQVQQATVDRQTKRSQRLTEIGAMSQKDLEATAGEGKALESAIEGQQGAIAGIAARLKRFGLTYANLRNSTETVIASPFTGVVVKANGAAGEIVGDDADLFQIADLSSVWVQAEVYEKDLANVTTGQQAFITVDTYPDRRFSGTVTYIADILDPQTRTARVRCEAPNPQVLLKLDMFATIQLPTKFSTRGITAPNAAIQQWEGKNYVFVRTLPTTFAPREVSLGKVISGDTEIVTGLKPGDPVVVNGAFHLKSIVLSKELGEE